MSRTYYVVTKFVMESEPQDVELPDDFDFAEEFVAEEYQTVDNSVVSVTVLDEDENVVYSARLESYYDDD